MRMEIRLLLWLWHPFILWMGLSFRLICHFCILDNQIYQWLCLGIYNGSWWLMSGCRLRLLPLFIYKIFTKSFLITYISSYWFLCFMMFSVIVIQIANLFIGMLIILNGNISSVFINVEVNLLLLYFLICVI